MVGIFSRFSVSRSAGHRRTQSALDEREVFPPNSEAIDAAATTAGAPSVTPNGIENAVEFKPVEHPTEPLNIDRPIQCPFPEPSILNDGRIWKERVPAVRIRKPDIPVMKEGRAADAEAARTIPRPPMNRVILPSISAPEHSLLKLLEESGIC
ncbi:uncharacterized protein LOC107791243 [Nicotiana tabacum]|uniref:Uncharacterized protein LOC107791243 n=1 Tax=Nicotiana tabacum TaxID=4097 RepID=A0A1S3ZWN1_TOBAC|nr:uncharacterized protein LOC104104958 [Nicotiana tomentosiformis]XP_016468753.1 PREDICTED: uncharacterized protein LOC107791243 [Nicotiana tabacum]